MRKLLRRIPASLALLMCGVAVLGATWALLLPLAQAPDEDAHYGYAQVMAEDLRIPDEELGPLWSPEHDVSARFSRSIQVAQIPESKPEWSELSERAWLRALAGIPPSTRDDGGHRSPNSASSIRLARIRRSTTCSRRPPTTSRRVMDSPSAGTRCACSPSCSCSSR